MKLAIASFIVFLVVVLVAMTPWVYLWWSYAEIG